MPRSEQGMLKERWRGVGGSWVPPDLFTHSLLPSCADATRVCMCVRARACVCVCVCVRVCARVCMCVLNEKNLSCRGSATVW